MSAVIVTIDQLRWEREHRHVLGADRCPHCGYRLILARTQSDVPFGYEDLQGCIRPECPGHRLLYLRFEEQLLTVSQEELDQAYQWAATVWEEEQRP